MIHLQVIVVEYSAALTGTSKLYLCLVSDKPRLSNQLYQYSILLAGKKLCNVFLRMLAMSFASAYISRACFRRHSRVFPHFWPYPKHLL